MKFPSLTAHSRGVKGLTLASLMLLLWLATFALIASPELHHLFHSDSQAADHHCLITQVQQHLLLAGVVVIAVPLPEAAAFTAADPVELHFLPACDYRVSPSRAPPLLSSSATGVG